MGWLWADLFLVSWILLNLDCFTGWQAFSSAECQVQRKAIYVLVGSVVVGFLIRKIEAWWKERQRKRMFSVTFTQRQGSIDIDHPRWKTKIIPLGKSEHEIKVRTKIGIDLSDINVRFLTNDEALLPLDDGHSPNDIGHCVAVTALQPQEIDTERYEKPRPDRFHGLDCEFKPPYRLVEGKVLVLKIGVKADEPGWEGQISFQAFDGVGDNKKARVARFPVQIMRKS